MAYTKHATLLLAITASVLPARADTVLGLTAGLQFWRMDGRGSVANAGQPSSGSLRFATETQGVYYAALEHPIPLLPNLRFRHTDLAAQADNGGAFRFNARDFSAPVRVAVDLGHDDVILYYEVLDNLVSLDAGINLMQVDGRVVVADDAGSERLGVRDVLPTLYLAAAARLPMTGLSVAGEVSGLAMDGSSVYDYQVQLQYDVLDHPSATLGLQLGYRATRLSLDGVDGLDSALRFNGPYLGVEVDF